MIVWIEPDFFNPDMCPGLGHWKMNTTEQPGYIKVTLTKKEPKYKETKKICKDIDL
jgi:hypothetical protein